MSSDTSYDLWRTLIAIIFRMWRITLRPNECVCILMLISYFPHSMYAMQWDQTSTGMLWSVSYNVQ